MLSCLENKKTFIMNWYSYSEGIAKTEKKKPKKHQNK